MFPVIEPYDAAQAAESLKCFQDTGYEDRWEGLVDRLCRSSPIGFKFKDIPYLRSILVALSHRLRKGDPMVAAATKLLKSVKSSLF
jgi:hypothetical protein